MPEKTKAQLIEEIQQLKAQQGTPARTGDFRDKMIRRLQAVYAEVRKAPRGVTEPEFIALAQKTATVSADTAKRYLQLFKNCGYLHGKVMDKGKWVVKMEKDADGNEVKRILRDGETQILHGEEVWQTETRLVASRSKQPDQSIGEHELEGFEDD